MEHDVTAAEEEPPVGPQVIWAMDETGVCTLSTGPGLATLGLRPGQLEGLNLFDLYAGDEHALGSLRRVLTGDSFTTETPFGGRVLSVFYQPTFDADGAIRGAIGVSTDVTEQRRLEAEGRSARERITLLAELSAALTREALDPEAILALAVRSVTEAVGDVGLIWLLERASSRLRPRALWGFGEDTDQAWRAAGEHRSLDSHLLETGAQARPRIFDLARTGVARGSQGQALARLVTQHDVRTVMRLPLRARGNLIGAVDIGRCGDHEPFSAADGALAVEIAERCALALDNALLLEERRAARENLLKFKALADASRNLIAINDPNGRALYVNPRVFEVGIAPAGENVWPIVSEQLGEESARTISETLARDGRWAGDVELVSPAAMVVRAEAFTLNHPDTGAVLGQAWIVQDVTELRTTEAALRTAVADLKQFKALVEASPDFIAIADPDSRLRYLNPNGRAMVGLPDDVAVSDTVVTDYLSPTATRQALDEELPAVIERGHWEGESTLLHRDGSEIPVAVGSFLIRDPETGEPFALATVQRDIAERKAAETALRDLADQRQSLLTRLVDAQDAERARIAADVHDDPVQALASVDLRLGLLRRRVQELAPTLLSALDPLQESVSGATGRLRALLFDLEPPDLHEGLAGALRRAADETFDGTSIRWQVHSEHEPGADEATQTIAYRVAREAMINARKHSRADTVLVAVGRDDDGLCVIVTDDGVGVPSSELERSPGHRGVRTMQDRAEVAGGWCRVAPAPGGGTEVRLWLPLTAGEVRT